MNQIKILRKSIKRLHGCDSQHKETVNITETFQGQTVWDGSVEVFKLRDHPQATHCYAWTYDKGGVLQHVAVLGVPPVKDAQTAVQAFLVSLSKKESEQGS